MVSGLLRGIGQQCHLNALAKADKVVINGTGDGFRMALADAPSECLQGLDITLPGQPDFQPKTVEAGHKLCLQAIKNQVQHQVVVDSGKLAGQNSPVLLAEFRVIHCRYKGFYLGLHLSQLNRGRSFHCGPGGLRNQGAQDIKYMAHKACIGDGLEFQQVTEN